MPGDLELALNGYVTRFLSQPNIEIRSVTITPESVSISVRKNLQPITCRGIVGIDRNLNNITVADSENRVKRHDLTSAQAAKANCKRRKRRFSRNDVKVRRRIYGKYGRLEKDRVGWLLHNVSANIALQAKLRGQAIVMEDLKGIRKLYRRGNGQGSEYRSRMNSWSYAELQRQIQYKAEWDGVPVIYVRAYGTSARCSTCGHRVLPEENRQLHCPKCHLTVDRDVNATRNILARGLRFKPVGSAREAMVAEPAQQKAVICKVDADQLTPRLSDVPTRTHTKFMLVDTLPLCGVALECGPLTTPYESDDKNTTN